MDVSLRGAVSIARRLQDPLAELVKIDPKSIGVGQYQHDLSEAKLSRSLDAVVEDCVNAVGVDVNTASAPLLTRVSGIGAGAGREHRRAPRRQRPVPHRARRSRRCRGSARRRSSSAPASCASRDGDDPLDASSVHPEAYPVVRRILAATGGDLHDADRQQRGAARRCGRPSSSTTRSACRPSPTSSRELEKPGRDPRPAFKTATFAEGVEKIADLEPGMVLEGVVTNVAAFGAFVDVGVHQDGLVHVSAMSHDVRQGPARGGQARRRRPGQGARRRRRRASGSR